jgi:hypothetical protein
MDTWPRSNKISGGFRCLGAAAHYANIRPFISTTKSNGLMSAGHSSMARKSKRRRLCFANRLRQLQVRNEGAKRTRPVGFLADAQQVRGMDGDENRRPVREGVPSPAQSRNNHDPPE